LEIDGAFSGIEGLFRVDRRVGDTIPIGREKLWALVGVKVKSLAMRKGRPLGSRKQIPASGAPRQDIFYCQPALAEITAWNVMPSWCGTEMHSLPALQGSRSTGGSLSGSYFSTRWIFTAPR
jgi:hypothetical protein